MVDIIITIPDNKVQLVLNAVTFYIENERGKEEPAEVTGKIALAWMEAKLILEVKRLVKNYQEQVYRKEFTFDDPIGEQDA
jgi:hypothetical protein